MRDAYHQDDQRSVLHLVHYPIVSHAQAPETTQIALQNGASQRAVGKLVDRSNDPQPVAFRYPPYLPCRPLLNLDPNRVTHA